MVVREAWYRNDRFSLLVFRIYDFRRYRICIGLAFRVAKCCFRIEKIVSRDVLTNRRKNSVFSCDSNGEFVYRRAIVVINFFFSLVIC